MRTRTCISRMKVLQGTKPRGSTDTSLQRLGQPQCRPPSGRAPRWLLRAARRTLRIMRTRMCISRMRASLVMRQRANTATSSPRPGQPTQCRLPKGLARLLRSALTRAPAGLWLTPRRVALWGITRRATGMRTPRPVGRGTATLIPRGAVNTSRQQRARPAASGSARRSPLQTNPTA